MTVRVTVRGLAVRRVLTAGLVCGLALPLLAACGSGQLTPTVERPGPPASHAAEPPARLPHDPCRDWTGRIGKPAKHQRWKRTPLPAGFAPVLLISCDERERRTAHDGEWTMLVEQHATSGLDAVVAAIRSTPPPPPTGEYGCTSDLVLDPWFLLVDRAGHVVLPVIPHDRACDKPIDVGLSKLHYTVVSAKRLQQQATAAELATGCTDRWKNEPRMMADDGNQSPATSRQVVSARPVTVCTYRSPSSGDPEVGDFTGGARLSDEEAARLGPLMQADPPGVGVMCPPVTDYAVVHTADGSWTYVDLAGCEVMYVNEGETFTSPVPDLVKAIKDLKLQR